MSLAFLGCAVVIPSCSQELKVSEGAAGEPQSAPVIKTEPATEAVSKFASYRKWHRVNDKPIEMTDVVRLMCRTVTAEEAEGVRASHPNPHTVKEGRKTFTVFVNDIGKDRLLKRTAGDFPIGTVLVKEKHKGDDATTSELLTVMVKREKGFAPKIGDWEFLVLDGFAKAVQKGDSKTCVSCHTSVSGNDFVYADYVPKQ